MGYKTYLSGIMFGTLLSGISLGVVILSLDPEKGFLNIAAFFLSLFFLLFGSLTLAGFYGRRLLGNEILYANVGIAARQGFLGAIFLDVVNLLKAYKLLVWWDALLLLASLILIELYFRAKD